MSQEELAAKAQVSRASVQNWEGDRRQPRRAEAGRLAAALGVTVDALKEGSEGDRLDAQEIRDALQAALELGDAEEMRAALSELLERIPPTSEPN
jgi:transcriptional regulator with XRE-family HTH domain